MSFAQPLWFWSLALLPVLVVVFFHNERRRRALLGKLIATRLHERLAGTVSVMKRRWRFALVLLGLVALIVSLAQPRYGFTWQESKRRGRDVIIAIDTSKSMLATDLAPNRLTRAKLAAQDLVTELHGDRVGVIAFAGGAFLQAPLTADSTAVLASLQELDTEIIPRGGTDIAGAIRTAMDAFGKGESDNHALIIFTDGEELDADGVMEAEKQKDVLKIFTVGMGSSDGSLIPLPGAGGGTQFLKDNDGQIVKSRLDEDRLRKIAEAAGGFYLRLQNSREQMGQLIRDGLGKMTEKDIDAKVSRQPIERYQWPLGAGILLLAASMLIGERRRATLMKTALLAVMLPAFAHAKNSGVEAYERKDFKGAEDRFSKQLRYQPESPELHFNVGSAAYQSGELDKALEAFSKAVTSPDPKLHAKAEYNLGNTLFKRGAELKEKEPKILEWKNALQHYDQALKMEPKNGDAKFNRDLVEKMLADLEKEQQQQKDEQKKQDKQDKKDKDKKDSKDEQKKDGEKKDQEDQKDQQDQQKKDEQNGDEKDTKQESGKDGEKKDQEKQDGQKGDPKDEKGKEGEQPQPEPAQPDKKKEGELKEAPQFDKDSKESQDAAEQAEAEAAAAEGRMTERQAKSLLDSLKAEDAKVHLLDPREQKQKGRVIRDW